MEIKLFITGDYCPIGRNETRILRGDFSMIDAIAPFVKKADLAIANLEAPITANNYALEKSGPNIKGVLNSLIPLQKAGFGLVTLANNHILDYGEKGLKDTIDFCEKHTMDYVGAGSNLEEARRLKVIEIKNKKIGVLNFSENEFCAATETTFGANPVNVIQNHKDIVNAKSIVDFVLVIAHGGREHYPLPTPKQRERYRFYIESGADIVIGHHSHCYSGYELYNGNPIFYSLGNFLFDYKKKYQKGNWTKGFGLELAIDNENLAFNLVPFHQGRRENPDIVLYDEKEENLFLKEINKLNKIIVDDKLFNESWNSYLETQSLGYKGMLFIQNKYIRVAITKKLLPGWFFHSKQHKTLLLNLFRCETHREIMISILEKNHR